LNTGRLAPTPSGHLHLGNALAFGAAWLSARPSGRLLLRVEDVDGSRARDDIAASQRHDLRWLGLHWDEEVTAQSQRSYGPWLAALADHTYHCRCTRKQRLSGGPLDPCIAQRHSSGAVRFRPHAPTGFTDHWWGAQPPPASPLPAPILKRADGVFAYNLAVVADDIADGVTEVVRGADLLDLTHVQLQLWRAFGATPPSFTHIPLVVDQHGKKLSKSHGALELRALRDDGWTPTDVWTLILSWLGLPTMTPARAAERYPPLTPPAHQVVLTIPTSTPSPREAHWTLAHPS